MRKHKLVSFALAAWLAGVLPAGSAHAQVGVSIGINFDTYPELVAVPGLPVYYAPALSSNYFFGDGLFWIYASDSWYESPWYNGPWMAVGPEGVPPYILRIPVRYYRQPPVYFQGWEPSRAPRWNSHWGPEWSRQRQGWERTAVASDRAPLPSYQRGYEGARYPGATQQQTLLQQNYHYGTQGARQFEPRGGPAQPARQNLALPQPMRANPEPPQVESPQPARQNRALPQPMRPSPASPQSVRPPPVPPQSVRPSPRPAERTAERDGATGRSAEAAGRRQEPERDDRGEAQDPHGRDGRR